MTRHVPRTPNETILYGTINPPTSFGWQVTTPDESATISNARLVTIKNQTYDIAQIPSETRELANGNGSLMRILPIALAYADDPSLVAKAAEISALTHAHERSKFCCAFFCLVVSELIHGTNLPQATAIAWDTMDTVWKFSPAERSRFDNLHPDKLFARQESQINSTGHVIDTLEAALWTNAQHDNYPKAVLHAVNLGDDTDTTACVAGALAGLIHGEAGIPQAWLESLVKRDHLEAVANSLTKLTGRAIAPQIFQQSPHGLSSRRCPR